MILPGCFQGSRDMLKTNKPNLRENLEIFVSFPYYLYMLSHRYFHPTIKSLKMGNNYHIFCEIYSRTILLYLSPSTAPLSRP